jgi:hypothetical protein
MAFPPILKMQRSLSADANAAHALSPDPWARNRHYSSNPMLLFNKNIGGDHLRRSSDLCGVPSSRTGLSF